MKLMRCIITEKLSNQINTLLRNKKGLTIQIVRPKKTQVTWWAQSKTRTRLQSID